jgi:hypothetical protein
VVVGLSLTGWSFVVAVGGVVIAVATYFANRQAITREQVDRKKAIDDAWAFEWAAQRPVVYPVLSRIQDVAQLPVKNGGRGPALNVVADLEHHDKAGKFTGSWDTVIGTVAVGDIEGGWFAHGGPFHSWDGISGVLRYGDLAGGEHITPFRFSRSPGGYLELRIEEQQHRTAAEVAEQS